MALISGRRNTVEIIRINIFTIAITNDCTRHSGHWDAEAIKYQISRWFTAGIDLCLETIKNKLSWDNLWNIICHKVASILKFFLHYLALSVSATNNHSMLHTKFYKWLFLVWAKYGCNSNGWKQLPIGVCRFTRKRLVQNYLERGFGGVENSIIKQCWE